MKNKLIRNKTARQQDIVNAARKIITSRGTSSLTVREIAKELKITDSALYRHFKSKKDIIELLIEDIEVTLLNVVKEAAGKNRNPSKKLEEVFFSHLSYAERGKGLTFIIINETLNIRNKRLQGKMYLVVDKYLTTIKTILYEGIKSGVFRKDVDTVSASIAFFGMVQATVTLWALSGFKSLLQKKHLQAIFNIYKNGITK